MYIVAYTIKIDKEYLDKYSANETIEDAHREYDFVSNIPDLYSASICGVLHSTDYEPYK